MTFSIEEVKRDENVWKSCGEALRQEALYTRQWASLTAVSSHLPETEGVGSAAVLAPMQQVGIPRCQALHTSDRQSHKLPCAPTELDRLFILWLRLLTLIICVKNNAWLICKLYRELTGSSFNVSRVKFLGPWLLPVLPPGLASAGPCFHPEQFLWAESKYLTINSLKSQAETTCV